MFGGWKRRTADLGLLVVQRTHGRQGRKRSSSTDELGSLLLFRMIVLSCRVRGYGGREEGAERWKKERRKRAKKNVFPAGRVFEIDAFVLFFSVDCRSSLHSSAKQVIKNNKCNSPYFQQLVFTISGERPIPSCSAPIHQVLFDLSRHRLGLLPPDS